MTIWGCIVLSGLSQFGVAQVITVRVIDATNGHPLHKQRVSVSLLYDKGEPTPAKYEQTLNLETSVDGKVQFTLPEPPPRHLSAQVSLSSGQWRCGCSVLATTQDLIQKGIVSPLPGTAPKKSEPAAITTPNEILFLARPLTFFERLLYPLVKG